MNKTPYAELLAMLSRHRGVVGSFVVSERDGLAVDSNVQIGVQAEAVAALAASLHRKARLACGAAGCGVVTFLRLDAETRWHLRRRARRSRARHDLRSPREHRAAAGRDDACREGAHMSGAAAHENRRRVRGSRSRCGGSSTIPALGSCSCSSRAGACSRSTGSRDRSTSCRPARSRRRSTRRRRRSAASSMATPFTTLHHPGQERQIFLGELATARGVSHSSHGVRRRDVDRARAALLRRAERSGSPRRRRRRRRAPPTFVDFESDLNRNLAKLFGRI